MSSTVNDPQDSMSQDLVHELLKDRRRDRFWKNFRFVAWFCLIAIFATIMFASASHGPSVTGKDKEGYVSLIRLDGMIAPQASFSAQQVIPLLQDAFADTDAKGVVIDINSGGGTPVQAAIIHDEIIKLKKKYKKKVIVVGEDLLASGAYFVAVSGDKIYVNPNTVTGSIGVIMQGFGFEDLIKKVGVQRRVLTSGIHKDRLDPFAPATKEDEAKLQSVIDEVHENFNQAVIQGRQGKLGSDPQSLFTGDFWTGQSALKLGLVDALGNLSDAMLTEFNVTSFKDYSESNNVLKMLSGQLGAYLDLPLSQSRVNVLEKL